MESRNQASRKHMPSNKPDKQQLEELAKQIRQDQKKENPAEKRLSIKTTFKKAIKKMGQTPPPKKETK